MSDIPAALRDEVVLRAGNRCEYCGLAQAGQEAAFKFCLDPEAARSLLNEAQMLARVRQAVGQHPGIVHLLDTSLTSDPPFLVY